MGTSYFERREQARWLVDREILNGRELAGTRIVLGDFNEWTKGLASRLLKSHFKRADIRGQLGRRRSYPGILPLLDLDHIYFDEILRLEGLTLHRSRTALIASDHLPLVADFSMRCLNGYSPLAESSHSAGTLAAIANPLSATCNPRVA